tara:strand:- start:2081 stop:2242 length:162 start_codon:yes stop_codon:yes gene_type:complete
MPLDIFLQKIARQEQCEQNEFKISFENQKESSRANYSNFLPKAAQANFLSSTD